MVYDLVTSCKCYHVDVLNNSVIYRALLSSVLALQDMVPIWLLSFFTKMSDMELLQPLALLYQISDVLCKILRKFTMPGSPIFSKKWRFLFFKKLPLSLNIAMYCFKFCKGAQYTPVNPVSTQKLLECNSFEVFTKHILILWNPYRPDCGLIKDSFPIDFTFGAKSGGSPSIVQ